MGYKEYWDQIHNKGEELNSLRQSYWMDYSSIGTWQFWITVALLVVPLIILCFTVDKKRIFELLFFGYTVHIIWAYASIAVERYFLFIHTYYLAPILPYALNMNASVLPVGFLLLYQYCTKNNKNFFLYTLILSVIFAFGFSSIEKWLGLVEFGKGMNQFYLFLIDVVTVYTAYFLIRIILKVKEKAT